MAAVTTRARDKSKRRPTAAKGARATDPAPTLAELQEAFQRAVLSGDDAILGLIPPNTRTNADILFGVYRNAYVGRLVEIIGNDHPLLKRYLGDEAFDELARAYVAARPSQHPNARWVSHRLPEFISELQDYSSHPVVGELTLIERALSVAFDAPDSGVLKLDDLATVAPEDWPVLRFRFHGAMQRLDMETNALDIWSDLKSDSEARAAVALPHGSKLMVFRKDTTPMVRRLGDEEAMLVDEAAKGLQFSGLCELAATYDDPDGAAFRVAQYLGGWISSGLISQIST